VDRVEVYLNGRLRKLLEPREGAKAIVDVHGKITMRVPDRDSWVVIIAMGLDDENVMSKVSLPLPFGEIQLSKLASDAFSQIPVVSGVFTATPRSPTGRPFPRMR
jgi:hypothetical protein